MRTISVLVLSAGLAVATLTGCSGGSDSAGGVTTTDLRLAEPQQGAAKLSNGDAASPVRRSDAGRQVSAEQLAPRKLARKATMKVRVKDVDEAAVDARSIAEDAGGYVGSERSRKTSARLTLTVPARELEPVLDELAQLGKPEGREVSVKDVTDVVVDVNSRVKSQRRSIERARDLFDQARTINDIVRVEERLSAREAELESLLARQQALDDQVQMAPVTVALLGEKKAKPEQDDEPAGFVAGLTGGWDAFVTALAAAATAIGAAAPFLLAFGVPALVLIWALRRRKRAEADPV